MKTLLMSILCTFIGASLFAQVDSTNNMNSTNPTSPTTSPTMNTTNTNNNMNDSTSNSTKNWNNTTNPDSSKAVTPPATQGTMNMNATNSDMNNTNSNMNMNSTTSNANSNLVNPNNIPGQVDASLPVMETFVPQDVVAQVKEKFPNQVIYDITAVKAPVDSASMQNDSMMNHQNTTAMNSDSSMNMNQNSTSMNQNSTMNMNQNGNTKGMAMDTTKMPEKFNYVVRVLQNGQMTTETLASDGTAMLQPAKPSGMNNELNQ